MLVAGADVSTEVQAVSFVQLAGQTAARKQTHRLHTETHSTHLSEPLWKPLRGTTKPVQTQSETWALTV